MKLIHLWWDLYRFGVEGFVDDKTDRNQNTINKIAIHHSACCEAIASIWDLEQDLLAINQNHKTRLHDFVNWFWTNIAYHCIVTPWWKIIHTRPRDEYGWHAWDYQFNLESIWICYLWNWEVIKPTQKIYEAMAKIVVEARNEIWSLSLFPHSEIKATACPWKLYDIGLLLSEVFKLEQLWDTSEESIDYSKVFSEEDLWQWETIIKNMDLARTQAKTKFVSWDPWFVDDILNVLFIWLERLDEQKENK